MKQRKRKTRKKLGQSLLHRTKNLEIARVIKPYVPNLKQCGKNLKAKCPFHPDEAESLVVSSKANVFHCFGCGASGDSVDFLMKVKTMGLERPPKLKDGAGPEAQ